MDKNIAGVENARGRPVQQANKSGVPDEPPQLLAIEASSPEGPAKGAVDAPPPLLGHLRLEPVAVQHAAQRLAPPALQLALVRLQADG
eukprot:4854023-Pyramimonas_sp.AAC.1